MAKPPPAQRGSVRMRRGRTSSPAPRSTSGCPPRPRGAQDPAPAPSHQQSPAVSWPEAGRFLVAGSPRGCRRHSLPALENAASSPAASHCLMSTKYFHVANYLVRLCCCGQRWCRENPPGAALAPQELGRVQQPHPPHAPQHPPAAFVSSQLMTFPRPQRDTGAAVGKRDLPGI